MKKILNFLKSIFCLADTLDYCAKNPFYNSDCEFNPFYHGACSQVYIWLDEEREKRS